MNAGHNPLCILLFSVFRNGTGNDTSTSPLEMRLAIKRLLILLTGATIDCSMISGIASPRGPLNSPSPQQAVISTSPGGTPPGAHELSSLQYRKDHSPTGLEEQLLTAEKCKWIWCILLNSRGTFHSNFVHRYRCTHLCPCVWIMA